MIRYRNNDDIFNESLMRDGQGDVINCFNCVLTREACGTVSTFFFGIAITNEACNFS